MRRRLVLANLAGLTVLAATLVIVPALASFEPRGSALEVAQAIAARHGHGYADDQLSPEDLSHAAASRPVFTTCGTVSVWAVELFREAGHEARVVTTLTLEPWNGLDNGHTMVSVRESEGWVVYDLDRDVRYTDLAGQPLSLRDLVELVPTDEYAIVPLGGPIGEGLIRETNRRLLQVPGVRADGEWWFRAVGEERLRVESYAPGYHTLPPAEWLARFYL